MAADDNEVWGPGEMTRALKRIETKVDEGNGKAVPRDLYDRDRKEDGRHFERLEKALEELDESTSTRFTALQTAATDNRRFSTGNWLTIGITLFTCSVTLFVTYFHGGA